MLTTMETNKIKRCTYFIGVDISKHELDLAVMQEEKLLFHREITNRPESIMSFMAKLKQLPRFTFTKAVFVMEHTGIYGNHLVRCLKRLKTNIVSEDAMQIKNSSGKIRGKYDKVDAIRIAEYAFRSRHTLRPLKDRRPVIQALAELNTVKNRLLRVLNILKKPLKEQADFVKKGIARKNLRSCRQSIAALEQDLGAAEDTIRQTISGDAALSRLMKIITSVYSVGPVTALQVILSTNEFINISDPKKFASYAGVAPFHDSSGKVQRKAKVSPMANKKMKALLHLCAMVAICYESDLKRYYLRKTAVEGKNKMSVINAVRYKLILRIFACVRQDRCYESDYRRPAYGTAPA